MPGRSYTGNDYRYGFNGKEKDDEVSGNGNQYDYGFRIYNPRLGKFLSVDPLQKKFPFYSPYHFAGNTPIMATDIDGREPDPITFTIMLKTLGFKQTLQITCNDIKNKLRDIKNNIEEAGTEYRRALDNYVQGQNGTADYNNRFVPSHVQNTLNQQQAAHGIEKLSEGYAQAMMFSAKTMGAIPGFETLTDPIFAVYHYIQGDNEDALAYAAGFMMPGVSGAEVSVAKGAWHHVFTNKNFIRGQQWSKKFEPLFQKAGYKLDDAINKVFVKGHKGPHPDEYHQYVYDQILEATEGLKGKAYKEAFDKTLNRLSEEVSTIGSYANKLLTNSKKK